MIAFANLLYALAAVLNILLNLLLFLVIARAIISWVSADPYNPIVRFITMSTDIFILPIRRKVNLVFGAMDFTPIVLLLVIYFLKFFLVQTLIDYSNKIRMGIAYEAPLNRNLAKNEQIDLARIGLSYEVRVS